MSTDERTDARRYCESCNRKTKVQRTRGNNGLIEFCPGCSFPYDFGSDDRLRADGGEDLKETTKQFEISKDGIRLHGEVSGECTECDSVLVKDDLAGGLICPDCGASYGSIFKITRVSGRE